MPYKKDDDEDLFEDDFEFVDDEDDDEEEDDDDSELDEEDDDDEDSELDEEDEEEAAPAKPKRGVRKTAAPAEPVAAPKGRGRPAPKGRDKAAAEKPAPAAATDDEPADEEEIAEEEVAQSEAATESVGPPADYVVHVYEFRKFKRTMARDFTSEDADKFAAEYNRTSANHSRWAVSGNRESQPAPKI